MWSLLLGLINPLTKVTGQIVEARIAREQAKTNQAKIEADERVKTLESRRDVLVAEASISKINIIMRCGFAIPLAFILWKILIFDKLFGGFTPALGAEVWMVMNIVLGFYFLYEGAMGVTRVIKR